MASSHRVGIPLREIRLTESKKRLTDLSQSDAPLEPSGPPQIPTARIKTLSGVPSTWQNEDDYWNWLEKYVSAIIAIAVLGGQITFSLIVSDLVDPASLGRTPGNVSRVFEKETVRLLIAISWLSFTSTLGVAVIVSLLFTRNNKFGGHFGFFATFLLNFLPIGAFLLLSLAAAAYVPIVGWIGVAFISGFGVLVLYFWVFGW